MHIVTSIGGKRIEVCEAYIRVGTEQFGHDDVTGLVWGVTQRETWFGFGSRRNVDKIGIRIRALDGTIDSIAPADECTRASVSHGCVDYEILCRAAFPPEHPDTHAYGSVLAALQKFTIPVLCNGIVSHIASGGRYQFGGGSFRDHAFILQKEGVTFFSGPTYGTMPGGGHWDGPEEVIATVPYQELNVITDSEGVRIFMSGKSNPLVNYDGIRLWNLVIVAALIERLKGIEPAPRRITAVSPSRKRSDEITDDTFEMLAALAVTGAVSSSAVMMASSPLRDEETFRLMFHETLAFATCLIQMRAQLEFNFSDVKQIVRVILRLQAEYRNFAKLGGFNLEGAVPITADMLEAAASDQFFQKASCYSAGDYEAAGLSEEMFQDFCRGAHLSVANVKASTVTLATVMFQFAAFAFLAADGKTSVEQTNQILRNAQESRDYLIEKIDRLLKQQA